MLCCLTVGRDTQNSGGENGERKGEEAECQAAGRAGKQDRTRPIQEVEKK